MILQLLIDQLNDFKPIQERTMERIIERREIWSDIILYLKNDFEGIVLYEKPSHRAIADLYNMVILLFNLKCVFLD